MLPYEIASLVALALVICKESFRIRWLPLGGGPLAEIGIVFGSAFIVAKALELLHLI